MLLSGFFSILPCLSGNGCRLSWLAGSESTTLRWWVEGWRKSRLSRVREEAVTDGVRPRGYMRRSTGLVVENAASQRFERVGRSVASTSETCRVMVLRLFFCSGDSI